MNMIPLIFIMLAKEFMAATCVMQSSSNELSSLVSDSIKCKQTKVKYKMR